MNNFKKIISFFSLASVLFLSACTDVELIEIEHIGGKNTQDDAESEAYYADLRAYKQQAVNYGRPVAFGWFSNWAPTGAYRRGYLSSLPDSMDIVSMWSGAPSRFEITPEQKADKEFAQKVKGLKCLEVCLLSYLGKGRTPASVYADVEKQAAEEKWSVEKLNEERKKARWAFWGFDGQLESESHYAALSRFAKAMVDSLIVNDWDGYDIDWEIGSGVFDMDGTLSENKHLVYLVKEMNKYMGPKSDPEGKGHKLLCIDGKINGLLKDLDGYVDYWILQIYNKKANLDRYVKFFKVDPKKFIVTENFEQNAVTGGRLLEHAAHMPSKGYKGGMGAYRLENDYDNGPDYKWMRQAIQINQQVFNKWKEQQTEQENK